MVTGAFSVGAPGIWKGLRANWTRSNFSVPIRRVPIGRVPIRRIPGRRGYIVMADMFAKTLEVIIIGVLLMYLYVRYYVLFER